MSVVIARQTIKVSLSASWRQLRCIEYSSSSVKGSEAVASWISWKTVRKAVDYNNDLLDLVRLLGLSSIRGIGVHAMKSTGLKGPLRSRGLSLRCSDQPLLFLIIIISMREIPEKRYVYGYGHRIAYRCWH